MQTTDRTEAATSLPDTGIVRDLPASDGEAKSLVARTLGTYLKRAVDASGIACAVRLPDGSTMRFGAGEPQFTVTFHDLRVLLGPLTEYALGTAYVKGAFDIDGDMYAMQEVRRLLNSRAHAGIFLNFLLQLFFAPATWVNRRAIAQHYQFGDDFYLSFMDRRYRFYSQCIFQRDDETLEEAAEHKLEQMFAALELKPGMRLLDIGGGWGGVHEYCGPRGVEVTSLTLAGDSAAYITKLDARLGLTRCAVRIEDFLVHRPEMPYDAVVIYGVIEHIPYYRRFCRQLWECLKVGGRFYLDASASIEKWNASDFTRRYIWPGSHAFLCLQDMVQELLYHGFDVVETKNETRDYELTMRAWAERLDAARDRIIIGWGERIYRIWRLYLWTGAYAFKDNSLQAYHLVAVKRADRGPRPSTWKRGWQFVRSLK